MFSNYSSYTAMQQRAVLALMHTAAGDKERSGFYLRQARAVSGDLFDNFTLNTASAFMMMAINYLVSKQNTFGV